MTDYSYAGIGKVQHPVEKITLGDNAPWTLNAVFNAATNDTSFSLRNDGLDLGLVSDDQADIARRDLAWAQQQVDSGVVSLDLIKEYKYEHDKQYYYPTSP